ncbi:MAG: penicillin-binding transpeptidase domain-containing protein, partial [Proteobacteria bacterium]|nr:penicillin-binding transpeptidase domain-containing protein [Pseudomonadota bacterium]
KNLSKDRILELYLNTMFMGHGAYGIGAASQTYFGKPIKDLQTHEFALLAGLFQAPSAFDPHKHPDAAIKRQKIVLTTMVSAGFLDKSTADSLRVKPLDFKPFTPLNETVAPFFLSWVRQLVNEKIGEDGETINDRGLKIYTTLDKDLQIIANEAIRNANLRLEVFQSSLNLKRKDRLETALLALDPATGSVLSMVGGRDFRQSQFNRAVSAKRSPGSAFKPVVYSLGLEKGMSWGDMVFVSPLDVGGYKPKNHAGDDFTEVTLIKALAKSMNTPVVTLAQKFGIDAVLNRAQSMGVKSEMPREIGVSIGGFSATMMDIARIYTVIANNGALIDTWTVSKIVDQKDEILFDIKNTPPVKVQVFSSEVAALLRSGLQAVLTIGTGSALADLQAVAAGKTGTSDDSRDNWFCGFTKNLVVTSWVGTDANAPMGKSASGASLALPAWSEFVHAALNGPRPSDPWPTPEGLTAVTIDPDYGTPSEQGVSALFRNDRMPKKSQASDDMRSLKRDPGIYRGMNLDD